MKRIKSALCATLITFGLYTNTYAGIIYGVSGNGGFQEASRDGIIYGVVNGVVTLLSMI